MIGTIWFELIQRMNTIQFTLWSGVLAVWYQVAVDLCVENFLKILIVILGVCCYVVNQHIIMSDLINIACYSLILHVLIQNGLFLHVNCAGCLFYPNICLLLSIYDRTNYAFNQITIIARLANSTALESSKIALIDANKFEITEFVDTLSIPAIIQAIPLIILRITVILILIECTLDESYRVCGLLLFLHKSDVTSFILSQLMHILVRVDYLGCKSSVMDASHAKYVMIGYTTVCIISFNGISCCITSTLSVPFVITVISANFDGICVGRVEGGKIRFVVLIVSNIDTMAVDRNMR